MSQGGRTKKHIVISGSLSRAVTVEKCLLKMLAVSAALSKRKEEEEEKEETGNRRLKQTHAWRTPSCQQEEKDKDTLLKDTGLKQRGGRKKSNKRKH